ncbi:MAG: hypothetical protein ACI9OJ_001322, partial [Myxococcota bacterium]
EGFVGSLIRLMNLDLNTLDHTPHCPSLCSDGRCSP